MATSLCSLEVSRCPPSLLCCVGNGKTVPLQRCKFTLLLQPLSTMSENQALLEVEVEGVPTWNPSRGSAHHRADPPTPQAPADTLCPRFSLPLRAPQARLLTTPERCCLFCSQNGWSLRHGRGSASFIWLGGYGSYGAGQALHSLPLHLVLTPKPGSSKDVSWGKARNFLYDFHPKPKWEP